MTGSNTNNSPEQSSAAAPHTKVEVRHRGRVATFLSILSSWRNKSSISNISAHFDADHVEDSVHVMIKHDKEAHKRKGEPEKSYTPRESLADRMSAIHEKEVSRKTHSPTIIEAREDDGESDVDRDILAAVARADCVTADAVR